MAAIRARGQPSVGSAPWIQDENAQVSLFCGQETEDFVFSARNEVEWLNEHMAEIFSKDQVNITDIFKTPGKLRGKTPRTARKQDPLRAREPLSDIFSTNANPVPLSGQRSSPPKPTSPPKTAAFKVAEDAPAPEQDTSKKGSTADSGYHGLSEDEMEVDPPPIQSSASIHDTLADFPHSPLQIPQPQESKSTERSTTDGSFHSAREELTKNVVIDPNKELNELDSESRGLPETNPVQSLPQTTGGDAMEVEAPDKDVDDDLAVEDSRSSSQESTPARQLVRKSSLTFAALPAREPITTKKSLGARISRTSNLDQIKAPAPQSSFLGRLTGGKSLGGPKQAETKSTAANDEDGTDRPHLVREESDNESKITRLHNKSSTQRLHERINLLGKSQPPRPTKSIPAAAAVTQPLYPDLQKQHQQKQAQQNMQSNDLASHDDDEDDWIQPPKPQNLAHPRPPLTKSISADVIRNDIGKQSTGQQLPGPGQERKVEDAVAQDSQTSGPSSKHIRTASASHSPLSKDHLQSNKAQIGGADDPEYAELEKPMEASTTPIGSPSSKRYVDGPLSASKSKLQSIMKTARGLFSSSAGVSAQAKMETLSPSMAPRQHDRPPKDMNLSPGLTASRLDQRQNVTVQAQERKFTRPAPAAPEARKTRSSTEKEEQMKEKATAERRQLEAEKAKGSQQETTLLSQSNPSNSMKEPTQTQERPIRKSPRKTQNQEAISTENETQVQSQPSQMQRPKDVRRPIKPAKDNVSHPKGPPVNIRIGMPSRRMPLTNAALSSSLQDSFPASQPKQAGVVKKPSNASLQSSVSNSNLKSSTAATKPRALIAAERKKEQDEKEAQRKIEQKREIERKRAAQQEEVRRQEQLQRQEIERQREKERAATTEDPKKVAQKQTIEKRRLEMLKKDARPANRPANDNAPADMHQAQAGPTSRPELGGARPPSRQQTVPDSHRPAVANHPVNPSKGAIKRVFDPENDSAPTRPAKPPGSVPYQQTDSKRRRTNDDELEEFPIRPTMAPPIRQSGIRKDGPKASMFSNNYTAAPPPASHYPHAPSLLKSTTSNQAYQQHIHQTQQPRQVYHTDTSKYREGNKIPFADNPNPPNHLQQPHKTPLPSKLAQAHDRQSPQYPNGENIQLAEIQTDSEDSESSPDTAQKRRKAASLPDWAQSPNLRQLLEQQEDHLDADAVFGPVASPHMEEMFRERHHRFRSRTSSANWAGQDRLTEDEIRRDVEARARMRRDGGWTFGL